MYAADSTGDVSSADQAAVAYVEATYPGSSVASVLSTTADTVAGVAVYDVSVTAPAGGTYLVQVQQSNDAILSATLTIAPVTNPPSGTPPIALNPSGDTPDDSQGSVTTETGQDDATENEVSAGASATGPGIDGQGTDVSSGNGQNGATSISDSNPAPSSSDGNSQNVGTSSQGGSSDSSGAPTTNGDN
ncbi:MAG TPA: hypothetical protein VFN59_09260 [Acidimicrobiales bacterium]|nr:hypothetical protein [Acidimicrobiales bacterium]